MHNKTHIYRSHQCILNCVRVMWICCATNTHIPVYKVQWIESTHPIYKVQWIELRGFCSRRKRLKHTSYGSLNQNTNHSDRIKDKLNRIRLTHYSTTKQITHSTTFGNIIDTCTFLFFVFINRDKSNFIVGFPAIQTVLIYEFLSSIGRE
jgi:hypothetical protein